MPKNWKQDHDPFARPLGCNGKYGTSGTKKHRRQNQTPCAACKASEAHYACELRRGQGSPRLIQPCGTNAAYKRHTTRGEKPCFKCAVARAEYQANQKRARKPQQTNQTMTTAKEPTMCEHREALQKAAYELDQQRGNGIINLGKLRHMLEVTGNCEHDNQGDR